MHLYAPRSSTGDDLVSLQYGLALVVAWLAFAPPAPNAARIQTKEVEYREGGTVLKGFIAWDDAVAGKRPGVLVVHEWWGLNDHARNQARRVAEAGYVGFALDMYGAGKVTTHPQEAQAFATEATKDAAVVAARFNAALDLLKRDPHVDPARIAAIGYCFGGGVVLGMARSGADLAAVVSFHGSLGTKTPAEPGKVKARVLVLAGGADPFVPPEHVEAFRKEMQTASTDRKSTRLNSSHSQTSYAVFCLNKNRLRTASSIRTRVLPATLSPAVSSTHTNATSPSRCQKMRRNICQSWQPVPPRSPTHALAF